MRNVFTFALQNEPNMNLLIGNQTVELNFSTKQDALNTRASIMVAYDEIGMHAFFNWMQLLRKYPVIEKAYRKAMGVNF